MAIHRNSIFLSCVGSSRLDRVMCTMYGEGGSHIDYEEEKDDVWFFSSSRNDRVGYIMSSLLDYFKCFESLSFLRSLFGVENEYNRDFKEYCRLKKFDKIECLKVIDDISLFFNAVLSADSIIFDEIEGYTLEYNYIKDIVIFVINTEVGEENLQSSCSSFSDFFVLLKLIQRLFQNSITNGMSIGYMSNSAG